MALSNAQLLMLDNLIYTDFCQNGMTVEGVIDRMEAHLDAGNSITSCEMTSAEWSQLIDTIREEPSLLNYTIQNYKNDTKTGMRAACFVDDKANPKDVNVVFRGTAGDYEWHDNGQGGYLSDTNQQELAAKYVNELPEAYGDALTVTGHSKGGNKAQYVTIATDRVARCVSYDGQGFSPEFLEKYKDKIAKRANSITSISAKDDFVNCLLYPIAGTKIYIETEEQKAFQNYHKPNILLDSNGNLRPQGEQSDLSKFINEYTTYVVSNLDDPERQITIDGLIALLEKGEDKESILQTIYAGGNALTHLDDFAFNYVGDTYGMPAELAATYIAAVACPLLFTDDLLNCGKEILVSTVNGMIDCAQAFGQKLAYYGEKAANFANKFVNAVSDFARKVEEGFQRTFNGGYRAAENSPYIRVNTSSLRGYADRLVRVNQRISTLDRRMDSLYTKVGLRDLWNLLQADLMTGYSGRISNCAKYLYETADDLDTVERKIITNF